MQKGIWQLAKPILGPLPINEKQIEFCDHTDIIAHYEYSLSLVSDLKKSIKCSYISNALIVKHT